ncbi:MAG: hypothetical protein ACUVQH_03350 [Thermogutta sp.]
MKEPSAPVPDSEESPSPAWGLCRSLAALTGMMIAPIPVVIAITVLSGGDIFYELFSATLALGISLVGGTSGLVVMHGSRGTSWEIWSPITAMVVRMVLTLVFLAGALLITDGLVTIKFLLYVILFYVVTLSFETFLSLHTFSRGSAAAKKTGDPEPCGVSPRRRQSAHLEASSQHED